MSEAQTAEAVAAGDFVTGNFEIQATLGKSGKALRLSGYIYAKNDKEHINAQVDQLMAVCDRQQAAAEIPALEAELERHFSQLRINKGHLEGVQSSNLEFQKAKEEGRAIPSAKKKVFEDSQKTIEAILMHNKQINEEIEKGLAAIEVMKKKAGLV